MNGDGEKHKFCRCNNEDWIAGSHHPRGIWGSIILSTWLTCLCILNCNAMDGEDTGNLGLQPFYYINTTSSWASKLATYAEHSSLEASSFES